MYTCTHVGIYIYVCVCVTYLLPTQYMGKMA